MLLRPATKADESFIRELSTEAFAPFGDYRDLLPNWTAVPGVSCWIAEERGPCGFVMVGFYYGDAARTWVYGDMLAIAVSAHKRGAGLGRLLLRHAIAVAEQARTGLDVRELRLTVAEDNARARHLFASEGFEVSNERHGRYDGGQVALRMTRPLL